MSLFGCKHCEELRILLDKSLKQAEIAQQLIRDWESRYNELSDRFKEAVDYNEKLIKEDILLKIQLNQKQRN